MVRIKMHSYLLEMVIFENFIAPAVFMIVWAILEVRVYNELRIKMFKKRKSTLNSLRPPSNFESKYSEKFIEKMSIWTKDVIRRLFEHYEKSDRDLYYDFVFWMELGQYIQIMMATIFVALYYIKDIQYITLAILFQSIISMVFTFCFHLIKHKYYPREVINSDEIIFGSPT